MRIPGSAGLDRTRSIALFALLLVSAAAGGAPGQIPPADPASRVDEVFASWSSRDTAGCSVAVAEKGKTLVSRAYGMADLEHDVPNAPATVFEAGSVSKQFTAAAVFLLVQQGKLSLADDVRKHVPELPVYDKPITIDHLIHHTSGLRDWGVIAGVSGWPRGTRIHTHAHVLDIASRQKALNHDPGAEFSYTNTGYNLLAVIVERVSGQSFAEFTRQNIFMPLGMTRTGWRDDFTRIVKGRAIAYAGKPGDLHSEMPFENVHGNGGLLTTSDDLLLWNENFTHGKVGGPALIEALQRRSVLNGGRQIEYAGGLFVTTYQGLPEISHGGATAAYRAFLARYPEQQLSVALLCNLGEIDSGAVAHQVADLFLAGKTRPAAAPSTIQLSPESIAARVGLYRNLRTGDAIRLLVKDGALRSERGASLSPVSETAFLIDNGPRIEFGPDSRSARVFARDGDEVSYERVAEASPGPSRLAEYAGEYESSEAEATYRVAMEEGKLVLRARPDISLSLAPTYADAFQASNGFLVRFMRNAAGAVSELSLGLGRVRDLRFSRVTR